MSFLLISTDLDGTLLDHHTYSSAAADATLQSLRALQIPCILNTSKTFAELEQLRPRLLHEDAFCVENGAALYIPKTLNFSSTEPLEDCGLYWRKAFGPSLTRILEILGELRTRYRFRGFSQMTDTEVAQCTGLSLADAGLALQRQFTEPLLWQDTPEALARFSAELADAQLQVQHGGRFAHVMGLCDKGQAMLWIAAQYQRLCNEEVITLALGDGHNDVPMLQQASIAVVVRSPTHPPPEVPGRSDVWLTEQNGPEGWASAVNRALTQLGLKADCRT